MCAKLRTLPSIRSKCTQKIGHDLTKLGNVREPPAIHQESNVCKISVLTDLEPLSFDFSTLYGKSMPDFPSYKGINRNNQRPSN